MKCPKCGHTMEPVKPGFTKDNLQPFWRCADWKCFATIPWDDKRDGDYSWQT